jgi:hypothetical protein
MSLGPLGLSGSDRGLSLTGPHLFARLRAPCQRPGSWLLPGPPACRAHAAMQLLPAPPPPGPTETVSRPDPGIARGRWEAPAWAFWVALAVILAAATLYGLRRFGLLQIGKKGPSGE